MPLRIHYDKPLYYHLAHNFGLRVPTNEAGKFPKIVKYGDSCASNGLDLSSVCFTDQEVECRRQLLLQTQSDASIVVQNFICGTEFTVVVVEMGSAVVSLTPLQFIFPPGTSPYHAFLTSENKFKAVRDGRISTKLVEDSLLSKKIERMAETAFKVAGMCGGGWARVDMRLDDETDRLFVLEVNPIPTAFYPKGKFKADWIIENTFPGGHLALFETLAATKLMKLGTGIAEQAAIAEIFSTFASQYDSILVKEPINAVIEEYVHSFNWDGSVLDLGCGTGVLGRTIHEKGTNALISGIDISPGMVDSDSIRKYYKGLVQIGSIQELVMTAGEFNHISCFSAFQYLDSITFTAVLSRMFMLARNSVTVEVDDLPESYIIEMEKHTGNRIRNSNNVSALRRFGTPPGWKKVRDDYVPVYNSPHFNISVSGYVLRFERDV